MSSNAFYSNASDIASAAATADTIRQQSTIITVAIDSNDTVVDLQPISSGDGYAFHASIDQLSTLTDAIVSAMCGGSCMHLKCFQVMIAIDRFSF